MSSSHSAEWHRVTNRNLSTSGAIAAGTAGLAGVVTVPDAKHTVRIQRIAVQILAMGAQTITFRDTAGTPVVVATIPASSPVGTEHVFDFGPRGYALTEGKNLDIFGTAGPAYNYTIDAYARQTSASAATTIDRTF